MSFRERLSHGWRSRAHRDVLAGVSRNDVGRKPWDRLMADERSYSKGSRRFSTDGRSISS